MYQRGVPIPDYLVGLHSSPNPVGTIDNGFGDRMAGSDQLDVTFSGVGRHGSAPEFTNFIDKNNIISNKPSLMGSEDFHHLVIGNRRTVYDYIRVGTANVEVYSKAVNEGKLFPFYNHNGNYEVDLSAIPLGTKIGATAILRMFRK